jgi:probable F420-dependent oxidoreductase
MRFSAALPMPGAFASTEPYDAETIMVCANEIESAGFDGCCTTDHPAPDAEWLATGGGHHALDPFVMLSFAAAATNTLRLQTYILVLAYRNPLLTVKSATSLDALSSGRLDLGVASGYLESEFASLGVDFAERNELTDEAIDVIRTACTEGVVTVSGRHFHSRETMMCPQSVQRPHPPLWVGGNSQIAMRRAVDKAQGWIPLRTRGNRIPPRRTHQLENLHDLGQRIELLRRMSADDGREKPFDIIIQPFCLESDGSYFGEEMVDEISQLEELGITWVVYRAPLARSSAEYLDEVNRFAQAVIR